MFGIAWGVGSCFLLAGVGEGFRSGNKRELAEFGEDIIFIFPRAGTCRKGQHELRPELLAYLPGLHVYPYPGSPPFEISWASQIGD
jgi:hypothetical protein